jgi:signal transduction histidine kinase/ActR/RegA family two-component response regulator
MSANEGFGPSRSHAAQAASGQSEPASAPPSAAAAWAAQPLLAWARTAPVALAGVADDGRVAWVNPAFEALTGFAAAHAVGTALELLLADVATPSWLPPPGEFARRRLQRQDGTPLTCDVQCDAFGPDLRVLTLVDRGAEPAQDDEVRRLAALLEFVQTHARIGMWERNVRTREGRWDAHMFRFFDIDPRRGTPTIAQIAQASVPQDRLFQALSTSMEAAGQYSHRYRLLTPAGTLRRVQAHWEVFAGADGRPDHVVGLVMDDTETFELASSLDEAGVQLQLATELADVSMWRHDLVTQRLHLNARAAEVLGLESRPGGLPIDELRTQIHPDDLMEVLATYQRALQSYRPEDLTARYRHRDGGWRHIFTRRITQRDGFGMPIAFSGVALDVTEQVERMQRADELARRLDDVTTTSGIGVWRALRGDGSAEWNAQMYAMSGLPPDQPAPGFMEWVDRFVHPDDRERVRAYGVEWAANPDVPAEIAHRIVHADGQVRHVVARARAEPESSPYSATGVAIDVTERELALAALREATERSALATRAAGIGIWEWDADSGASRWDEEMFVLRGLEPRPDCPTFEEMAQWVHVDDRHYVNDQIQSARIEDRPAYYEFRIIRADGAQRWLASRSLPVRDERGRTRMRLGVNWDITEAREAAAARQERALVLRESQAKSELLARMSHELRTPMNAVLGFTQLLLADDVAPDDADAALTRHARLEHIRSAGEHLLTLINNVLELSRLDGPERDLVLQPVQVGAVTEATLPLVEGLAQQHGVHVIAPASPLWVRADPVRLKQVLVNLLTNAIKYNRTGGSVHVDVSAQAGHVLIRVADDGIGMTSAQQTEAFEPFNRAGAERDGVEGTGIGLTIVKALVEGMGGCIGVNSARGVGSVFEVRLDAAAQSGPHALPTRRLLYIEDNAVNVLIVSELVRRRGDIEFDSMPDGASGVARAAQSLPGLTLVDMQLPDIDGLEVLARLRANPQTAGLRVVALSANAIPADIARALAAGFDDYWTKPLDFKVFNAALDQVFGPHGGEPSLSPSV